MELTKTSVLSRYIARRVIEDLYAGRLSDARLAHELNNYPLIDLLAENVAWRDAAPLIPLTRSEIDDIAGLAISLLRNKMHEPEVRACYFEIWNTKSSTYAQKWWVMFRLLNYPYDESLHQEIYKFILDDWDRWIAPCVEYFGNGDTILDALEDRLKSSDRRDTKVWLRLCQATAATDQKRAKNLIDQYSNTDFPMAKEVALDMLKRLS